MHVVVMVESVLVLKFRQSYLVPAVVVLHFFQIVLTSLHHIHRIVCIPRIRHGLADQLHQVRRLVRAIGKIRTTLDVVSTSIWHTHMVRAN